MIFPDTCPGEVSFLSSNESSKAAVDARGRVSLASGKGYADGLLFAET